MGGHKLEFGGFTTNQKEFNHRLLDKGIYITNVYDFTSEGRIFRLVTARSNFHEYMVRYWNTGAIDILKSITEEELK
jgi:hypothetical protein